MAMTRSTARRGYSAGHAVGFVLGIALCALPVALALRWLVWGHL